MKTPHGILIAVSLLLAGLLAGCGGTASKTASGRPEVIIKGTSCDAIMGRLTNLMLDRSFTLKI